MVSIAGMNSDRGCFVVLGGISQTLTYPFDVLRRKMQVVGMKSGNMGYKYDGAIDALRVICRTEGFRGLYRGLWPNLSMSSLSFDTLLIVADLAFSQSQPFDRNIIFHLRAGKRLPRNTSHLTYHLHYIKATYLHAANGPPYILQSDSEDRGIMFRLGHSPPERVVQAG
jgi:hypothetical protein